MIVMLVALQGCSTLGSLFSSDKETPVDARSAQAIYAEAKELFDSGAYDRSVKLFEQLEAKFPYGRYAQQAQLNIAYAYFRTAEPASALAAVERFIKLHPNHPNVDYAYYLKGLVTFNEDQGVFGAISMQDTSERDPKAAQDSYDAFKELVTRFPQSKYAEDSRVRMAYLYNTLATHQLHVARYYYKLGAYLAAANRAQDVLRTYPRAPVVAEALAILSDSYHQLGMNDLAGDIQRVQQKNFPQAQALASTEGEKRPWWKFWAIRLW